MTADQYEQEAHRLGRLAFEEGRDGIPALDPAMMDLIAQNRDKPFGSAIAPLTCWTSGWVQAALAAPDPENPDDYDPIWDNCERSAAAFGGRSFRSCTHGYLPGECPVCDKEEV